MKQELKISVMFTSFASKGRDHEKLTNKHNHFNFVELFSCLYDAQRNPMY